MLSSHIARCRCPGGREAHLRRCAGRLNYSLQGFPVESGAVPIPGGDAASQDALHSANVELSACSGHAKTQPTLADSAPAPLFPAHFDAYSKVNLIFFPSPLVSQPLTPFCYKSGNLAGHHSCIEPLKTYTYSPCRMERSERNGEKARNGERVWISLCLSPNSASCKATH